MNKNDVLDIRAVDDVILFMFNWDINNFLCI